MDEHTISPAGDPFHAAPHDHSKRRHVCNYGWVSMEVEILDPDTGEEAVEEVLYLCRRCAEEAR